MGTAKKIGVVLEVIGIVGVVLMDLGFITDWLEFLLARVILVPVSIAEVWLVLLVNAIFLYFAGHLLHDHTPPPGQTRIEEQSQRNIHQ